MQVVIAAICAGAGQSLPTGKRSGIAKTALTGPVLIEERGIATDEQVDRRRHGYPAMALHHFPHDTYAWLRHHFAPLTRLAGPGSFGENLSSEGLLEHDVCIGDRFRLGSAILEVTQPRQPCATIEQHLGAKGMVKALVASARSGWFYRVLQPGLAEAGDELVLIDRVNPRWSIARVFLAVYGSAGAPAAELERIACLDRVSDRLVRDITKRLTG